MGEHVTSDGYSYDLEIIFDTDSIERYRCDRTHRIGQTKNVTVYRLIAKDSIEEKIVKLQESKKELADSVLSGETKSLGTMSREELRQLLGV